MPTTTLSTTLLESVNIVLANLGESPVNTLSGGALPQQVSLALNTLEEVSTDIQSKGWWFNQKSGSSYSTTANVVIYPSNTGNNWGSDIPEEARRYVTIRASRIAQTRLIGSEELQKFSYNEELVSLAVLQQAHVRNSNGVLDFNAFPAELRSLGMDEVMFLQGTVEEKMGTLRLGGELANVAKTKAETDLVSSQEGLVDQQKLTEVQETAKRLAEASLVGTQEELIEAQTATETEQAQKVEADTVLVGKQSGLIDAQKSQTLTEALLKSQQALTELENTAKVTAETSLIGEQEDLLEAQAIDVAADTTIKGKQGSLIDAQRATEVEQAQKVAAEAALAGKQGELTDAQKSGVLTDSLLKSQQALTELENTAKVTAETSLIGEQEDLLQQQYLTEVQETTKRTREAELIDTQEALLQKQILTEAQQVAKVQEEVDLLQTQDTLVAAQATDVAADTTLKGIQGSLVTAQTTTETSQQGSLDAQATKFTGEGTLATNQAALITAQKDQLIAQTAIEVTAEKAFYDGVVAGTQDTYRDFAAELRIMAVQEATFQSTPAYKKVEMLKDAAKLRLVTATETGTDATELLEVNKVMRFIGESPVTALNSNSLASECVRLLRDTDTELQGRGWYFNIDADDVIVPKALGDTPQKYREYLSVRVAILLTELYPQSGVDIQRLPKMEIELRAYFKDREFDDANYSIFDNYDTASRIGINRNYDLS